MTPTEIVDLFLTQTISITKAQEMLEGYTAENVAVEMTLVFKRAGVPFGRAVLITGYLLKEPGFDWKDAKEAILLLPEPIQSHSE